MPKTKIDHTAVRARLVKISKIHLLVGMFFVVQIIAYDASKLITPEVVLKRWILTGGLIIAATIVWYLAKLNRSVTVLKNLTWFLVVTDIIFAAFMVYQTRGMASRAVFLFILPILAIAVLQRRGAIYLTSVLAAVTYTSTAVAYFVLNFNEGYKIELYGEIGLYAGLLLATGWMTWGLVKQKHSLK